MGLCYARIAGVAKSTPLKGMAMVSGVSLPFGPPAGFSLWPSPVIPAGMFSDGGANFVTATEIVASVSGTYTDVKILAFGASGVGTIEGILYVHNTQTTASSVTQTGAIAANSGTLGDWFNIALPAGGIHVAATVPVTVGLWSSNGFYWSTPFGFSAPVSNGPLTARANGTPGQTFPGGVANTLNGRFNNVTIPPPASIPANTFNDNKFWVDVVFVPD